MKVRVLQTLKAEVSQTGDNIAAEIGQCLEDFSLKGKVEVMTTDNAKAMVNATTSAGIPLSLGCFAHTLNLSTQKAMNVPTVGTMLAVIRPPIIFFRNSYVGKIVLKEKQKALDRPSHNLILDCKTRWNSSYMMVERFVEQYPAIVAASFAETLKKKDSFKKLQRCTDKDIERMEHFLEVVKLPYMITVAMSSEKRPTSGQVLPMIDKLEVHLAEKEEDEKFIKYIKSAIRNDLSTRYQDDARGEFLQEATALDPRFKGSPVVTVDVWDRITNKIEVAQVQVKKEAEEGGAMPQLPLQVKQDGLRDTDTPPPAKKAKLTAMEEIFQDEDDVMLPLLSTLARKYLIVPGTSVPSERVFSTAGDIVSATRATLHPDNVNMLLFLNKNT
ncbi:hypothetical protein KUCAC02_016469 [Chaenocephalus aceratus]|nr:hypothetical protein KUCAC02_016469 [Chaenocephalus aceratus]